ncbi:MAG: DcrB-related protein [Chloroflexi bacterium]|nr:DcrB-related protein [Chloroflexota bacterium]
MKISGLFARAASILVLLVAFACGSTPESRKLDATPGNQELDEYYLGEGYKIQPPYGWEVGKVSGIVYFRSPDVEDLTFQANINILEEHAPGITLKSYVDISKQQLPLVLNEYEVINEYASSVNGRSAHFLMSTFRQVEYDLQNLQMFVSNDDSMFVITATALRSTWESYDDLFDAALGSFVID